MNHKLSPKDIYPGHPGYQEPKTPPNQHLLFMLGHTGTPFVTPRGTPFLFYPWGDRGCQTTSLFNPAIRLAAIQEFVEKFGHPPQESTLRSAFRAFRAQSRKICLDVSPRIGEYSGAIHIDPLWSDAGFSDKHIQISPAGWTTAASDLHTVLPATAAPHPHLQPNPTPDPLAALQPLRQLLRLENDRPAWHRLLIWLLAAFRPPAEPRPGANPNPNPRDYPILQISGPASCGKTAAARILRSLVDPNQAPINFTPSTEAAAGRLARDNQIVFVDGVTRLPRRPAEVLARLSTGLPAKFHGELQNLSRPILLTTNEPHAADRLSTRILPLDLPALPNPLPQDELHKRFEAMRPDILAALLTLLSIALRRLPDTPCPENTRFPEAVQWAAAALENLDPNSLVCVTQPQTTFQATVTDLLSNEGGQWKGTATELAAALKSSLTARALSHYLKQISTICVTSTRTKGIRTLSLALKHPPELDIALVGPTIVLRPLSKSRDAAHPPCPPISIPVPSRSFAAKSRPFAADPGRSPATSRASSHAA